MRLRHARDPVSRQHDSEMADSADREVRVLLPAKPEDGLEDVFRAGGVREDAARKWPKQRLARILAATDLSPASTAAVRQASAIARENRAALVLAHAYQPPNVILEGYVPPTTYDRWDESLRDDVRKRMQPFLDEAQRAGVSAEAVLLSGAPYEAITEAAKDTLADLVVVGTHGRTGVPRFFLGSVAARVVSTAPCPVMTVRGE